MDDPLCLFCGDHLSAEGIRRGDSFCSFDCRDEFRQGALGTQYHEHYDPLPETTSLDPAPWTYH